MSKSLTYTALTTPTVVSAGNEIPTGSIVRRYGKCIDASGTSIRLTEPGYYAVDVTATVAATSTGFVYLTVTQDGVPVKGMSGVAAIDTANTQRETIPITGVVRVRCCDASNISVVVSSDSTTTPTIAGMAVRVIKLV